MSRLWTWPSVTHRAIIAAVAILLFAVSGAGRTADGFDLSETAGASERTLCVVGDDAIPTLPALPRGHCSDHCCQAARDPGWAAARVEVVAAPSPPIVDAAGVRRPDERPLGRASGWESSWSSRAPPRTR